MKLLLTFVVSLLPLTALASYSDSIYTEEESLFARENWDEPLYAREEALLARDILDDLEDLALLRRSLFQRDPSNFGICKRENNGQAPKPKGLINKLTASRKQEPAPQMGAGGQCYRKGESSPCGGCVNRHGGPCMCGE